MTFPVLAKLNRTAIILLFALTFASSSFAQSGTAILRGQVKDPSGASVADATILVTTPGGETLTATPNHDGLYIVKGLVAGKYKVQAVAKGFAMYEMDDVAIADGQVANPRYFAGH